MNRKNEQRHERYRRRKKGKTIQRMILIFIFSAIIIAGAVLWFLLSEGSEEHVILNPTDARTDLTIGEDTPAGMKESGSLQSPDHNAEWNLTLVNKWNPLPENYEINLVKVPGDEKVDERIYEPLMEMLEAAKEGNWNRLPYFKGAEAVI